MVARGSLHVSGVWSWEPYSFTFWQNRKQRGTKNVSRYKISSPAPSGGLPQRSPTSSRGVPLPPEKTCFLQRSLSSSREVPLPPEDAQALKVPQPSKTTAPAGHQVLKQAWEGYFTFKLQKASVKNWDKGSYSFFYFLGNRDSAGSNSELFMGQASILPLSRSSARSFLESAV